MKYTKDPRIALDRLAPILSYKIEPEGKSYVLVRHDGEKISARTAIRCLGFLAYDAMSRKLDVRDDVRWLGPVPIRGVKGWEVGALKWLVQERK